jgi:hypothetical protein
MTKKFAVFVEGLTEQEFTIRLLTELAGRHGIEFEVHRQDRGYLSLVDFIPHESPVIHVLVANCCNDGQVKSQIKDQYNSLKSAGYSLIVGLRDVYPFKHNDIADLEKSLLIGLPTGSLPIHLHLAIMEIEAWFLEEITHFPRIDNKITSAELIASGFDVNSTCACDLPHPAETLDKIYKSVGKWYNKDKRRRERTINALSYEELYVNTRKRAPSLEKFITSLEAGLFLL